MLFDLADGIRDATHQIRNLVDAFRLLSGSTKQQLVVMVDLERVLDAAVILTRAAHRYDAVIETDIEAIPPCPGQYVELASVLVALLMNALEAMDASTQSKVIQVRARARERVMEIRIRDTGAGMTKETLARAFEPFFTAKNSRQHAGLGLTMARQTVERFGGTIRMESEKGKGTTVWIQIPLCTETVPPSSPS
jgi:signal transduction histidine kinase